MDDSGGVEEGEVEVNFGDVDGGGGEDSIQGEGVEEGLGRDQESVYV